MSGDSARVDAGERPRAQTTEDSGAKSSAALSGQDIARLFGRLPLDAFKSSGEPASAPNELRGSQQ